MRTVIAALDRSPVAGEVLAAATRLAGLLDASVVVVHACGENEPDWDEPSDVGLMIRAVTGPAADAILDALAPEEVVLGVVGARGAPGGKRPAGSTALAVVTKTTKPVVVVPPKSLATGASPIAKILVPLEGTVGAGEAVQDMVRALVGPGVAIVAVHVFDPASPPLFLDRPEHDLGVWTSEFLTRQLGEHGDRMVLRTGNAATLIAGVGAEEGADLIVLSWGQDAAAGRAATVQEVLARTDIPVMLLREPEGRPPGSPVDALAPGSR